MVVSNSEEGNPNISEHATRPAAILIRVGMIGSFLPFDHPPENWKTFKSVVAILIGYN